MFYDIPQRSDQPAPSERTPSLSQLPRSPSPVRPITTSDSWPLTHRVAAGLALSCRRPGGAPREPERERERERESTWPHVAGPARDLARSRETHRLLRDQPSLDVCDRRSIDWGSPQVPARRRRGTSGQQGRLAAVHHAGR